jgi:uncharacterized protein
MAKFIFQNLKSLFTEVDKFLFNVRNKYPDHIHCETGCTECCKPPVKLTTTEAVYLQEGLKKMSKPLREELLRLCREPNLTLCPLLIEERCSVHEFRPLQCHVHGFPAYHEKRQNLAGATVLNCSRNFTGLLQEGKLEKTEILELDNLEGILKEINQRFCEDFFLKTYDYEQSLSIAQALLANFTGKNPLIPEVETATYIPEVIIPEADTGALTSEPKAQTDLQEKFSALIAQALQELGESSTLNALRQYFPPYHTASRAYYKTCLEFKPVRLEILSLKEYSQGLVKSDKPWTLRLIYAFADSESEIQDWKAYLSKSKPEKGVWLGISKQAFTFQEAVKELQALENLMTDDKENKVELQALHAKKLDEFKALVKNYLKCENFEWHYNDQTLEFKAASRDKFICQILEKTYPDHPKVSQRLNLNILKAGTELLISDQPLILSREKFHGVERLWQELLSQRLLMVKENLGRLTQVETGFPLNPESPLQPLWDILLQEPKGIINADKIMRLKDEPWGMDNTWGVLVLAAFLRPMEKSQPLNLETLQTFWQQPQTQELKFKIPEPGQEQPAEEKKAKEDSTLKADNLSDEDILLRALESFGKDDDLSLRLKKSESWIKALSPIVKPDDLTEQTQIFLKVLSAPDDMELKILEDLPSQWGMLPCEDWHQPELESFAYKIAASKLEAEAFKFKNFFPVPQEEPEKKAYLQRWLNELMQDFKLSQQEKDALILEVLESAVW